MKNVIIIMADQLRKDFLGCYGNRYVKTPNIDRIASYGTMFERCYVTNPLCMPSRMSLFTGMYVHNHQLWANGVMLPKELPTIADRLKKSGYVTGYKGKAHFENLILPEDSSAISRESRVFWSDPSAADWHGPYWGFDNVDLCLGHATKPTGHYGKWFFKNGGATGMGRLNGDPDMPECRTTSIPEDLHDSTFVGEKSAEFIRKFGKGEKPFFLTVSFPDPHHPFNPPRDTAERYAETPVITPAAEDDALTDRPSHYAEHRGCNWNPAGPQNIAEGMTEKRIKYVQESQKLAERFKMGKSNLQMPVVGYCKEVSQEEKNLRIRNTYAMIELIDHGVGRILEALEETGQIRNTIIVFTADHGELMGDHGLWKKGPFFFNGLLNVPLIVHDPDHKKGVSTQLVSLVDVFPGLCELTGIERPEWCDGVSFVPAMDNTKVREACLTEYRNGFPQHELHANAYTDSHYRFVQYNTGDCELTDLVKDPEERVNLANRAEYAQLLSEYRLKLLLMLLNTPTGYPERIAFA